MCIFRQSACGIFSNKVHACQHTHTHTYTHTQTHTYIRTQAHTHTHIHQDTNTHIHQDTHTHLHQDTSTHIRHTWTHVNTNTHPSGGAVQRTQPLRSPLTGDETQSGRDPAGPDALHLHRQRCLCLHCAHQERQGPDALHLHRQRRLCLHCAHQERPVLGSVPQQHSHPREVTRSP